MRRLLDALKAFPIAVLDVLFLIVLLFVYFIAVMPLGLLWRRLSPHASWRPAEGTRWGEPQKTRADSLEEARRQY